MSAIALAAGFLQGARLPDTTYAPLYFADQDWRQPNRAVYMAALSKHRPALATVLDLERDSQLPEVLDWAEEAAQFVREAIVVVPKAQACIGRLPRQVGGREVRLGYSVPTRFAGTEVPAWEFRGWPVHLLGGAPQVQMRIARYLDVQSADGNYAHKMAVRFCQFWVPGTAHGARNRYWPTLREAGVAWAGEGACYEAFRRSCENVIEAWRRWPEE